jgi:hypothetical protein
MAGEFDDSQQATDQSLCKPYFIIATTKVKAATMIFARILHLQSGSTHPSPGSSAPIS